MGRENGCIVWKPEFFLGTSYTKHHRNRGQLVRDDFTGLYFDDGLCEWGDIQQLGLKLARYTHAHYAFVVGTKGGSNPHGHIVAYSPDLSRWGKEKVLFKQAKAKLWDKGRLFIEPYNISKGNAGLVYTDKRHNSSGWLNNWVVCPRKLNSCRKNRCPFQENSGMRGHTISL